MKKTLIAAMLLSLPFTAIAHSDCDPINYSRYNADFNTLDDVSDSKAFINMQTKDHIHYDVNEEVSSVLKDHLNQFGSYDELIRVTIRNYNGDRSFKLDGDYTLRDFIAYGDRDGGTLVHFDKAEIDIGITVLKYAYELPAGDHYIKLNFTENCH